MCVVSLHGEWIYTIWEGPRPLATSNLEHNISEYIHRWKGWGGVGWGALYLGDMYVTHTRTHTVALLSVAHQLVCKIMHP